MDADQTTTDPVALMERSFMEEFLQARGQSLATLKTLPHDQSAALMKEASRYASARLTEVESRAHFIESIRGDADLKGKT